MDSDAVLAAVVALLRVRSFRTSYSIRTNSTVDEIIGGQEQVQQIIDWRRKLEVIEDGFPEWV